MVLAPGRKSIRVSLPGGEMEVAAVKKLGAEVATSFNVRPGHESWPRAFHPRTYSNVGAENLVAWPSLVKLFSHLDRSSAA